MATTQSQKPLRALDTETDEPVRVHINWRYENIVELVYDNSFLEYHRLKCLEVRSHQRSEEGCIKSSFTRNSSGCRGALSVSCVKILHSLKALLYTRRFTTTDTMSSSPLLRKRVRTFILSTPSLKES